MIDACLFFGSSSHDVPYYFYWVLVWYHKSIFHLVFKELEYAKTLIIRIVSVSKGIKTRSMPLLFYVVKPIYYR